MMTHRRWLSEILLGLGLTLMGPSVVVQADIAMKMLIVNPSDTEPKEFDIRSPLPPEVKPEHVLDTDGLKVEYDSQAGTYVLVGKVVLKPKESITKRIILEDVWVIPSDRFSSLRRETDEVMRKLENTPYKERGQMLVNAIERRLNAVEESQNQPFLSPMQHINAYRENLKTVESVETDLVSLRNLMVLSAVHPPAESAPVVPAVETASTGERRATGRGELSVAATWRLIFVILGLLGFVSISFFLVWQRQLKLQLAKQAAQESSGTVTTNGNGSHPVNPESVLTLPPSPSSSGSGTPPRPPSAP